MHGQVVYGYDQVLESLVPELFPFGPAKLVGIAIAEQVKGIAFFNFYFIIRKLLPGVIGKKMDGYLILRQLAELAFTHQVNGVISAGVPHHHDGFVNGAKGDVHSVFYFEAMFSGLFIRYKELFVQLV